MRKLICALCLLFLTLWLLPQGYSATINNEYLLKISPKKSGDPIGFFFEKADGERDLLHAYKSGSFHVRLDDIAKNEFLQRYGHAIDYLEPNHEVHALQVPAGQWALDNEYGTHIDAEKAWSITRGSSDIIVAVIDTGVDYNHMALLNNIWTNPNETINGKDDSGNGYVDDVYGWDFANNDNDPMDDNNHGTHCAGIIAANSWDVMGIAPNVKIMPLKFLTKSGSGSLSSAIKAIEYATDNGAHILSNSWGGGGYTQSLKDAVEYAEANGVLFVAAAGNGYNDNDANPSYPASYEVDNVVSVGASTKYGNKAYFSNYGEKSVHLFAPGYDILSTIPGNSTASYSGTSMACPYVSGVAALIMSNKPNASYKEVKGNLMDGVVYLDGLDGLSIANGQLNAYNALLF